MARGIGDYARDFRRNIRDYEGPLGKKIWLTLRNRAIATSQVRKGCCGHPGEPGC